MGRLMQIDNLKLEFIKALPNTRGVKSEACKVVGISPPVLYKWLKEDPDFKQAVENVKELNIDYVEGQLFKLIENLNPSAIIFYLKTIGRGRGYTQSTNIDISNSDGSLNNRILTTNPLLEDNNIQDAEVVDE